MKKKKRPKSEIREKVSCARKVLSTVLRNIEMAEERRKQSVVEIITSRQAKGHDRLMSEN